MVHSMHTPVPTGAGHTAPAAHAPAPAPHAPAPAAHAPTHTPSTPTPPANPNPTAGEKGLYVHNLCHEALKIVTGDKHLSFMSGAQVHVSIAALDRNVLHATPHEHSTEGSIPFDAYFFVAVKNLENQSMFAVHKAKSSRFNGDAPTIHEQAQHLTQHYYAQQKARYDELKQKHEEAIRQKEATQQNVTDEERVFRHELVLDELIHFVILTKRTLTSDLYNKLCGDRHIALLVGGTLREDTAYLSFLVKKAADRVVTMLSSVDKHELALSKEQVLQAIQTPFNFSAFKDDH